MAHGLGVALLPPDFAEAAGDAVCPVPLGDAPLSWTLGVVASATRPPTRALHAFSTSSRTTSGATACSRQTYATTYESLRGKRRTRADRAFAQDRERWEAFMMIATRITGSR